MVRPALEPITLAVPGEAGSVADARTAVSVVAETVFGPEHPHVDVAGLLVGELVTNAITHTASGHEGAVRIGLLPTAGTLRVDVTDDGGASTKPQLQPASLIEESGRGLALVDALATRWGAQYDLGGSRVWFELNGKRP